MKHPDSQFGVLGINNNGHLDFGRGNHLDIDPLLGEGLEHLCRNAGMAAHSDADDRHLADALVGEHFFRFDLFGRFLGDGKGLFEIRLGDREGEVGIAVFAYILHDNVYGNIRV